MSRRSNYIPDPPLNDFDLSSHRTPQQWYEKLFNRVKDNGHFSTETDVNKVVWFMADLCCDLNMDEEIDNERYNEMKNTWLEVRRLAE